MISIIIILLFFYNVNKIHHYGMVRLHSTKDYDYKIHTTDNNFIIS